MEGFCAQIKILESKIERQQTELAILRQKQIERLERELELYRKDIKSIISDNENLRSEIVELSGGVKTSGRAQAEESYDEWVNRTSSLLRSIIEKG